MRKLLLAFALTLAFTLGFLVTPHQNRTLQAQENIPCLCTYQSGTSGSVTTTCLGTANMDSVSCTVIGSQCFIGGWATWIPDTVNCLYSGTYMGSVTAIGAGSGGPSYFDPSVSHTNPAVAWGVLSTNCSGVGFGATMLVAHDSWTGGSACTCTPNTPTLTSVAAKIYKCGK